MELLILMGGLTFHPISPRNLDQHYNNHIGPLGMIANPYGVILVGDNRHKIGVIHGLDSVGGKILGPIIHTKLTENFAFVVGGYNYNRSIYNSRGMASPSIGGITPIIGLDANFELYRGKSYAIESHNILSIITTHSIGIKFEY